MADKTIKLAKSGSYLSLAKTRDKSIALVYIVERSMGNSSCYKLCTFHFSICFL